MARGAWSQYLEVGIGPDAEIFTKAPPMSAVGYGAEIGIRPELRLEQPRARGGAGRQRRGRDRRRDAGQRRQPARLRGPQRAAARQGQGQQRVVRDRPVRPPVRRDLHPRRRAHRPRSSCEVAGPDQFRLRGSSDLSKISRDPTDLVAARDGQAASVSRRHGADDRHAVRADRAAQAGRPRLHPHGGRPGVDPLAQARHAHQPRQPLRQDRALDLRHLGADAQPRRPRAC